MSIDHFKARAEESRRIFEDRLRHFVREWSPDNDRDRYEMQTQLMMLMRDAMRSQSSMYAMGVEGYAARNLEMASLSALSVIFKPDAKP
jgi:hypothetical protein